MKPEKDIHDYNAKYERILIHLNKSKISEKNKKLILDFDKVCALEGLSKPRRIKIISSLMNFAWLYLNMDFDKANKDALKEAILKIDAKDDYSPWTKQGYKSIVKKFYKWYAFGDNYKQRLEYPEIVSWLRVNLSAKDKPRVQASEILTEREIDMLIESAEHPRDKAFISMIYELGARIGEIGGLSVGDASRDEHSFIIDLTGKTGHRTPRIVISDPYLRTWLNSHPLKDNPNAPLWIMIGDRNKNKRMKYAALRALILRLRKKAKIKKRVYPHLFRHTRVTHLLINKQINETQAKVYFGWVPSTHMLSEYSHLVSKDVNELMLEIHGIKTSGEEKHEPKIKQCPRCNQINPKDHIFCKHCGSVLDIKTAIELDDKKGGFEGIMSNLMDEQDVQEVMVRAAIRKGLGRKLMDLYKK